MIQRPSEMAAPIDAQQEGGGANRNTHVLGLPEMIQQRINIAHGLMQEIESHHAQSGDSGMHDQQWYDNYGADRPK